MDGANLVRADLTDADLSGASLQGANLSYAVLRNADLRGANLTAATIRSTDLGGVRLDESTLWPRGVNPPVRAQSTEAESGTSSQRFSMRKERLDARDAAIAARDLEALLREAMRVVDDEYGSLASYEENLIRANVSTISDQLRSPDPDVVIIERAVARVIGLLAPVDVELSQLQGILANIGDESSAARSVDAFQSLVAAASDLGRPNPSEDVAQANHVAKVLADLQAYADATPEEPQAADDRAAEEDNTAGDRQSRLAEARLRGLERFYSEVMPANVGKLTVAVAAGIGAGAVAIAGRAGAIVQAIKAVLRFFG